MAMLEIYLREDGEIHWYQNTLLSLIGYAILQRTVVQIMLSQAMSCDRSAHSPIASNITPWGSFPLQKGDVSILQCRLHTM